jgi:hypothetical protein
VTALVLALGLALALLTVLVAGLLRSHAEILRRLHDLGAGMDPDASEHPAGERTPADLGFPVPPGRALPRAGATPAHDIEGETISGEAAHVAVTGVDRDAVLAFLSTGCRTCADLWSTVQTDALRLLPAGTALLLIARSADEESVGRLRELAPKGVAVLLSTAAWDDYEVPVAPYFVHVDGRAGTVIGEGAAGSWQQVLELLRDAGRDRDAGRLRDAGPRPAAAQLPDSREGRIDAELRAAGIVPGDPSLYLDKQSLYADEGR